MTYSLDVTFSCINHKTIDVIKETDISRGAADLMERPLCASPCQICLQNWKLPVVVRYHSIGGMSQPLETGLHRQRSAGWSRRSLHYSGLSVMEMIRRVDALPTARGL